MAPNFLEHVISQRNALGAERDALEGQLHTEREDAAIKLAACGVAAMSNTDDTRVQRIGRDNPYWTASYGDVCNAVDREMAHRAESARLAALVAELQGAWKKAEAALCECMRERDEALARSPKPTSKETK